MGILLALAWIVGGMSLLGLLLVWCLTGKREAFMESLQGKHVAITGGSSGIGLAMAKQCVKEGASITLIARDEIKLQKAAADLANLAPGCEVRTQIADVSDAESAKTAIHLTFQWKPIDILICSVGIARKGFFDEVSIDDLELVARTNFMGTVFPVHAGIPLWKQRSLTNPTSIVIVSSLAGLLFANGFNMYTATKYGLKGFAELLRIEMMPYKIKVSLICPSFPSISPSFPSISPSFPSINALNKASKLNLISGAMGSFVQYNKRHALNVDEVARRSMEGVKRGEFLVTTDIIGFLLGVLSRGIIPAEFFRRAVLELFLMVPLRVASFFWCNFI